MIDHMDRTYRATGKPQGYGTPARHKIQADMPWFKQIPAHVVYGAMRDAEKDYRRVVGKRANGQASELPRCRKRTQRSFYVLGNAITPRGIYPRLLGKIRSAEPLPDKPSDSRIIFEAGKFWLRVPYQVQIRHAENQGGVCAVDPGIRTFGTVYSPDGVGKVAQQAFNRGQRMAFWLDDLIGRAAKEKNGQRKRRMYLAASRMRLKLRNLVDTLHYQTIGWLFRKFDTVIFPDGNFLSACRRAGRKIRSKSVRNLLSFAFARFRDRLQFKAELLGKRVVLVCESYTSKTHNITGEIRQVGSAKYVTSQGIRIDRDVNGALGILLKALLDQPAEKPQCERK